ncbi:hypothetical protein V8C34DRAFT_152562 [Trichoderma compactum]
MWYTAAIHGDLATEQNVAALPNPAGPIDPLFFTDTLPHPNGPFLPGPAIPPPTGGQLLSTMEARLFNALGSVTNDLSFILVDSDLNCLKEYLWDDRIVNFVSETVMQGMTGSTDPEDADIALNSIRNVVAVMSFLNHSAVHNNMARE